MYSGDKIKSFGRSIRFFPLIGLKESMLGDVINVKWGIFCDPDNSCDVIDADI